MKMTMTAAPAPTVLTVGEWTWTDCGEEDEPALWLPHRWEIRAGYGVDAAYLAQMARDLMKLANQVSQLPKP
jgi:hypothetical protein